MATTSQSASTPSQLLDTDRGALVRITPETVLRATG